MGYIYPYPNNKNARRSKVTTMIKKKIYCFNNGGSPGFMYAVAIAEDGNVLAEHCCSCEGYMRHDLGVDSDWKHENYNKHYGVGNWEAVWVANPIKSPELDAAFELNKNLEKQGIPEDVRAGVTITFDDGSKQSIHP